LRAGGEGWIEGMGHSQLHREWTDRKGQKETKREEKDRSAETNSCLRSRGVRKTKFSTGWNQKFFQPRQENGTWTRSRRPDLRKRMLVLKEY
jgi:hypothetical protein